MKEYHKIETLYKRDMEGTKKLIEGAFRDPTIEYLKDNRWIGKEKIDGTNIRIYWDGHRVSFNGRTDNAQIPGDLVNLLNIMFCTLEAEQIFEEKFGEKEVYLFGEGFGSGIQKVGNRYKSKKDFILFDVEIDGYYLGMDEVRDIAKTFNVDVVKILKEGTLDELVQFVKSNPLSQTAEDSSLVIEGLVAVPVVEIKRRDGKRIIVKIKVEDFQ